MTNVMKQTVLVLVAVFATVAIAVPAAAEAAGDRVGVVEVARGNRLPLLVHIKRADAGVLSGTMDSPAQGAHWLPLAEIAARNARLTFAVPSIGGNYAGEWVATVKAWRGEWSQRGMHWPLVLSVAPPPAAGRLANAAGGRDRQADRRSQPAGLLRLSLSLCAHRLIKVGIETC
jgi:hypothetical protein